MIPIIDLFAGPGGLGEGFSALKTPDGASTFRIALSIEKDPTAHATLKLRSFFRQFPRGDVPEEYYDHLRGEMDHEELYRRFPDQTEKASAEAWNAVLGDYRKVRAATINARIKESLKGAATWVLIGGPPCQAYSTVGRSRVIPVNPQGYEKDKRHFLYKAYLGILAEHRPPIFVMENVKGILTAEVKGKPIIERLLSDLRNPVPAAEGKDANGDGGLEYKIYPVANYSGERPLLDSPMPCDPSAFIIRSELHKIPQARHRFILLGVRSDIQRQPALLRVYNHAVKMWAAVADLPRLRSKLSGGADSGDLWVAAIRKLADSPALLDDSTNDKVHAAILSKLDRLSDSLPTGATFVACERKPNFQRDWFYDSRLGGFCNHETRRHMESDLWRYFFAACYAAVHHKSPRLTDMPDALLPNHKNLQSGENEDWIFKDRFRVQVRSKPATTVVSHLGKDGHYFIHPDPLQCRSLTVREAARLQTFPDNYFFTGGVTAQYQQVGNAVPPLLAKQIAAIVYRLIGCDSPTGC